MAKNRRKKPQQQRHQQKAEPEIKRSSALDSFSNALANLGVGGNNMLMATEYPITRLTRDYNLLNSLYRNSWIAKKVINTIPDDMVKNWFAINANLTPDQTDRYKQLERRTKLKPKILEALYWGRLYGGAACLMLIEGHEDMLDEPLRYEDILPDSFKGLMVLDRWSGVYPGLDLVGDISDQDFGLPEYYEIKGERGEQLIQRVHHTRILRFEGRMLPYWEDAAEMYWGASEIEHIFDELVKRDNTSWNIAALVFQANMLVNKVDGLDQLIAMSDQQMQQDYFNLKSAMAKMRSNTSMMIIGKDEEISSMQYSFSGLNEIYESFMLDIAGASEIPVTKLFGRAPAGMNATGESDLQNYYDMVAQNQEKQLRPILDRLLPIMFVSEFGTYPEDLDIKFNPIQSMSNEDMANLVAKKTESIEKVYTAGIINQKIAMSELHEMSYTTDMFTNITQEDIEAARVDFIDETDLGIDPFNLNETEPEMSIENNE